jgi:hypothetical protein
MSFGTGPFGTDPFGTVPQERDVAGSVNVSVTIGTGHVQVGPIEADRASTPPAPPPPSSAERLACYLLPKRRREDILGDLEEDYRATFLPKFGPREARRMYWSHFIRSAAATVPAWIWTAVVGAVAWLWGKLGS